MDTDRDLLFGTLALRAGLIDAEQLQEACARWSARRDRTMAELLQSCGWITAEGRAIVERLMEQESPSLAGPGLGVTLDAAGPGEAGTTIPVVPATLAGGPAAESAATVADPTAGTVAPTLAGGTAPPGHEAPTLADGPPAARDGVPEAATVETMAHEPEAAGGTPMPHVLLSMLGGDGGSRDRYTVTRLHAKGGIGQVWLAHDGILGREIALKELRPERADNPIVSSRFLEEARITGQLEHPGIVPIYELTRRGGDQSPFYTMRFVRGRTLSAAVADYHGRRRAGTAGPLDLQDLLSAFLGVCNAIAYAHSRRVIHRDLKGQNVVLGDFGEVMVLDWGLAKILDDGAAGASPGASGPGGSTTVTLDPEITHEATSDGQVLGTPAYMAPEQAAARPDEIDRLSDVYSLGAILYEILAGEPPFQGTTTAEVLRKVREEPPRPPRALNPEAPAPLQAVCLKALAKAKADRYASAADLADEVRRFLADEPVAAYPEPLPRRLARWARRHRTAVAAASVLMVTTLVALSIGTVLVRRERDAARVQRNEARRAVDEMYTQVAQRWLEDRDDPLQRQFLARALAYYERFAAEDAREPAMRQERGRAFGHMGDILRKLGRRDEAERALQRAREILGDLAGDFPAVAEYRRDLADTLRRLAIVRVDRGGTREAEPLLREAEALQGRLVAEAPDRPAFRLDLARTLKARGDLLRLTGAFREAEAPYVKAETLLDRLHADDPAAFAPAQELAGVEDALGLLLNELGEPAGAESAYRRGLALQEALVAASPTSPRLREVLGKLCNSLALILAGTGDAGEEERLLLREREVFERLAADFPDRPEYRRTLARSCVNLGLLLMRQADPGAAEPVIRRAIELNGGLAEQYADVLQYRLDLGKCRHNLGTLLTDAGRYPEAEAELKGALAIYEALVRSSPDVPRYRQALAGTLYQLGRVAAALGRADAEELTGRALTIYEALVEAHGDNEEYRRDLAHGLNSLGAILAGAGDRPGAEAAYRRALGEYDRLVDRAPKVREYRAEQAACFNNLGELRLPGAEAAYGRSLALYDALRVEAPEVPSYRQEWAAVRNNLGECLAGINPAQGRRDVQPGRLAEAGEALDAAVEQFEALAADFPGDATYRSQLGYILENQGLIRLAAGAPGRARESLEQAVKHQKHALALRPKEPAFRALLQAHTVTLATVLLAEGDYPEAVRVAGDLSRSGLDRAEGCFEAARVLARSIALARADAKLPERQRDDLALAYGRRAVSLLREAADRGRTFGPGDAERADFEPLRSIEEFRQIVEPEAPPTASPTE